MPPRSQTRQTTRLQRERNERILAELYDSIDFVTTRIHNWDIFIQNNPDAVNIQLGIDSRNALIRTLNSYMIRLAQYNR